MGDSDFGPDRAAMARPAQGFAKVEDIGQFDAQTRTQGAAVVAEAEADFEQIRRGEDLPQHIMIGGDNDGKKKNVFVGSQLNEVRPGGNLAFQEGGFRLGVEADGWAASARSAWGASLTSVILSIATPM